MADVINKTTHEHLFSVNTPDYPVEDWFINPDADTIRTEALAREAAKPPAVQSEDEWIADVETRLSTLEKA